MKKISLLFVAILCLASSSFATVHTIVVADYSFTPSALTFPLGDSVKWVWSSGTHTTSSQTIPATAIGWNANITSTSNSYIYKPTASGVYNYTCNMHPSLMMASFTVTGTTGVANADAAAIFNMYPNPTTGQVHLQFNQPAQPVSLSVTDMNGRQVIKSDLKVMNGTDLDLKNMPNGLYVITAQQGGKVYQQELVVSH